MKIGIITIQKSEVNYGACLQCYALYRYLSNIGHECEVIDLFRPCHKGYVRSKYELSKLSLKTRLALYFESVVNSFKGEKNKRLAAIEEFNSLVNYSRTYRGVDELYKNPPVYDVYITGSDQVWNPLMPFRNDPYFLAFAKGHKISYAASFGIDSIPQEVQKAYLPMLSEYKHISVREESGAEIVKQITGCRPIVVQDPVFLLNDNEWRNLSNPCAQLLNEKYVFLYMLQFDERVLRKAKDRSIESGYKLVVVLSENRIIKDSTVLQLDNIGPREWIWLIDNAELMITTSFHGTALSLILNTPFVVLEDDSKTTNSRIDGMLSSLGLLDHIDTVQSAVSLKDQEYYSIPKNNCKLEIRIAESKKFLQNSLSV